MKRIDKQEMLDMIIDAKRTDPETGGFAEWLAEYLAKRVNELFDSMPELVHCKDCKFGPKKDGHPCDKCPKECQ